MFKFQIKSAGLYRTGGELYLITFPICDNAKNILKNYKIWATQEVIEDYLGVIRSPTKKELHQFGLDSMNKWIKKEGFPPKGNDCVLITSKGAVYGDYKKISKALANIDQMARTNISLPKSLHQWLRVEAARKGKSISEIIRRALVKYKKLQK